MKKTKVFLNIDVFVFAPCAGTAKQPSSISLKRNDPRRESNKEPPGSHRGATEEHTFGSNGPRDAQETITPEPNPNQWFLHIFNKCIGLSQSKPKQIHGNLSQSKPIQANPSQPNQRKSLEAEKIGSQRKCVTVY